MSKKVSKAVILAGGLGTRISEESHAKPKPMIEIGGMPIIWHIMKIYSHYGISDFVICCGYKGYLIKEYFANYFLHMSDVTIDLSSNSIEVHSKKAEPWSITLVDTGEDTQTGGRLKRISSYVDGDFCMTYGDGLGSIDVGALIRFHSSHAGLATMTAVQPPGRFGALKMEGQKIKSFLEKPQGDGGKINGGFFVLESDVANMISSDSDLFETNTLPALTEMNQLAAYGHEGFWQPMDTLRAREILASYAQDSNPIWLDNL
jgi:glucose-1-phosphate cytidylyltransferase